MCFNDNATQIISGGIDNIIKVSATTRLSFHFKQFEYILISRYVFLLMHEEFFFLEQHVLRPIGEGTFGRKSMVYPKWML